MEEGIIVPIVGRQSYERVPASGTRAIEKPSF